MRRASLAPWVARGGIPIRSQRMPPILDPRPGAPSPLTSTLTERATEMFGQRVLLHARPVERAVRRQFHVDVLALRVAPGSRPLQPNTINPPVVRIQTTWNAIDASISEVVHRLNLLQ